MYNEKEVFCVAEKHTVGPGEFVFIRICFLPNISNYHLPFP